MIHIKVNLISLALGVIILFQGCSYSNEKEVNCLIVRKMVFDDQLIRSDIRFNPYIYLMDSLSQHDSSNYDMYFDQAVNIYNRRKKSGNVYSGFVNPKTADSLAEIQIALDNKNLNIIINWFENIELNRIDTLNCYSDILFIFAHTPQPLKGKVINIIKKKRGFIPIENFEYLKRTLKF